MAAPINIRAGWDITSHMDGFALWFDGALVDVFPTLDGAANGRRMAREANAILAACLADPSIKRGA